MKAAINTWSLGIASGGETMEFLGDSQCPWALTLKDREEERNKEAKNESSD